MNGKNEGGSMYKKKIVIVLILIIFAFVIIFGINFVYESKLVKKIINNINTLNNIFNEQNLIKMSGNLNEEYFDKNDSLYRYNKDDAAKYIEKINELYNEPFSQNSKLKSSFYNDEKNEKIESLYINKKDDCVVKDIDNYKVVSKKKNQKTILIDNKEYLLKKYDGVWKFETPIIICK